MSNQIGFLLKAPKIERSEAEDGETRAPRMFTTTSKNKLKSPLISGSRMGLEKLRIKTEEHSSVPQNQEVRAAGVEVGYLHSSLGPRLSSMVNECKYVGVNNGSSSYANLYPPVNRVCNTPHSCRANEGECSSHTPKVYPPYLHWVSKPNSQGIALNTNIEGSEFGDDAEFEKELVEYMEYLESTPLFKQPNLVKIDTVQDEELFHFDWFKPDPDATSSSEEGGDDSDSYFQESSSDVEGDD
ncbi:hypothetical protein SSX86_002259 [Deinandra increscens subsp. villosa]|uniref:Uncharacterized protein n=1 Tax=Deinandra increscens subsp. villosa TaxID=3103831 RepID=A0AAP0DSI4_9ASTR